MKNNAVIEIQNMTFGYACHNILENINLIVNPGDAVAITGPNGAGKSTLLKLILGLLKPVSGTIKLFGDNNFNGKVLQRIGYVPQRATAFNQGFPTTVYEAVAAGRIATRGLFRRLTKSDYAQTEDALKLVGLYPLKNRLLSTLSGGQQQRVFIARALVATPDLLVLDEPTVGVDVQAQEIIVQLLKRLNVNQGLTLLIVSHEPEVISKIVNRQVCLDKKICHCGCHSGSNNSLENYSCSKSLWAYQQ
ncbi:metal ABC transporter ATP-binding protein [Peptococcaceae bacterium 1198_IL3148]